MNGDGRDAGDASGDLGGGCKVDDDCPRSGSCTTVRCEEGACVIRSTRDGVALPSDLQVEGDCARLVCDGRGQTRSESDDADVRGDGNPCHIVRCRDGKREVVDMPDDSPCNSGGVCQTGTCSICSAGLDCTRPSDCTEHRSICRDGQFECEDTGKVLADRACDMGKVCDQGSCVPCAVGAECEVDRPCFVGRVKSCEGRMVCEPQPQSGMACGQDPTGRAMFCVEGRCTMPCLDGPCMSASSACQTSHWDCTKSKDMPECVEVSQPDGTACDGDSICHAGECESRALTNGDLGRGLEGWETSGDGASFRVFNDSMIGERPAVSTAPTSGSGGVAARGSISQTFTVPDDAVALRFLVWGGRGHVRLKSQDGAVLEECTGGEVTDARIPVSWKLTGRRGQRLTVAIEDDLNSGEWAYINASGFDVIRDTPMALRNPEWAEGFSGWETTGDGLYFNVFTDANSLGSNAFGERISISTYTRDSNAASLGVASRGSMSQSFTVPQDAVALRFQVHGGRAARIRLLDGSTELHRVSGRDSDFEKVPVSWDLQPFRGMTLRLRIEDDQSTGLYGYVGTSGFDLITSYNGP